MKRKIERPVLSEDDIEDLRMVCAYYGYQLVVTDKQQLVISMEDVAYIQKDDVRGIFIVWCKSENTQSIKELLRFTKEIIKHDIIPLEVPDFKKSFITGLTSFLGWKKGVTLKEITDGC